MELIFSEEFNIGKILVNILEKISTYRVFQSVTMELVLNPNKICVAILLASKILFSEFCLFFVSFGFRFDLFTFLN